MLITYERLLVKKTSLIYYIDKLEIDNYVKDVIINYRIETQRERYIKAFFKYIVYIAKIIDILLALKLAENET